MKILNVASSYEFLMRENISQKVDQSIVLMLCLSIMTCTTAFESIKIESLQLWNFTVA